MWTQEVVKRGESRGRIAERRKAELGAPRRLREGRGSKRRDTGVKKCTEWTEKKRTKAL